MGGIIGSGGKSHIEEAQMVASMQAIRAAQKFDRLGPIKQQKGTLEAIELARLNLGNYQPELDESRRLTDLGVQGITPDQIEKYTNPYLKDVLDWSIREMEEAADRRRQERRGITSLSGNDFSSSGTVPNRYQVEDDLADRSLFREIGGLTAQQRMNAYQQATNLATDERNRQLSGGTTYGNYANQTSQLGALDVASLGQVGEAESVPEVNERQHLTNSISNYARAIGAAQPAVDNYQKTSPLSQILGLAGAVGSVAAPFIPGVGGALAGIGGAATSAFGGGGSSSIMGAGNTPISYGQQVSAFNSDRRLKTNIRRIGTNRLGIGVYEWTYLWGRKAIGVMSDELKKVIPEAVNNWFGYDFVDYSLISGANNG